MQTGAFHKEGMCSADLRKRNRLLRRFVPKLSFQKRPTDGQEEVEPPFVLPPPPRLHLPSVPFSIKAHWRPKIPTDVTNDMQHVFRSECQNKIQGRMVRCSRDLPKGNQQRAMVHHKVHIQYLLHSTGCR